MSSPHKSVLVMGISNCDTVKKARDWLNGQGVAYEFQDFKKQPPTQEQVALWLSYLPWETLINRQGTTWRRLAPQVRANVLETSDALQLALHNPSVFKRPVVQWPNGQITVGFSVPIWQALLAQG